MRARWHAIASKIQRLFRLVVLFCILRFIVGFAAIALFDREALAWGWEVTAVVVAAVVIFALVGLVVRAWSPPYPSDA